jgi:DegV family protein with EDD domain
MKPYQIFSDSSCDIPDSLLKAYDIKLVPFYISFDQDVYYKENIDITNETFYETMSMKKSFPTTSLPSVHDYINEFKQALKDNKDILCICLTQKFSGSYQSAVNAKQILEEQYPDANIQVVDSIQATAGQGLLLLQAAKMQEVGYTLKKVIETITHCKASARIMFTVDTLEYLSKGRRIGKVATLAGAILDLKPLIQLKEAELLPYSNVRGRKKSLEKIFKMVEEYFHETKENPQDYDFCIANSTTLDEALQLQDRLEKYIGHKLPYPIFQIGVTIGTYCGPGGIGICFVKKYDRI